MSEEANKVHEFCAMFPDLPRDIVLKNLTEAKDSGISDDAIVEELINLSALMAEGLIEVAPAQNASPSQSLSVLRDPQLSGSEKDRSGGQSDTSVQKNDAIAVEMVSDEPPLYTADPAAQGAQSAQEKADYELAMRIWKESIEEDEAKPSQHMSDREHDDVMQPMPAKRAKIEQSQDQQRQQMDQIKREREARWRKDHKHAEEQEMRAKESLCVSGPVTQKATPATKAYNPSFYSQLSSVRDTLRSKWHKAAGGVKRVWTMEELAQKEEEERKARIDRAGGPIPSSYSSKMGSLSRDPVSMGMRALELTNAFRATQKLPPLKWNQALYNCGLPHSKDMGDGKVAFGHDGFNKRMSAVPFPVRSFAENVAWNSGFSDPAKAAVDGWIQSPGHRKNMVGRFEYCGIAVYQNAKGAWYLTQLFASC